MDQKEAQFKTLSLLVFNFHRILKGKTFSDWVGVSSPEFSQKPGFYPATVKLTVSLLMIDIAAI